MIIVNIKVKKSKQSDFFEADSTICGENVPSTICGENVPSTICGENEPPSTVCWGKPT